MVPGISRLVKLRSVSPSEGWIAFDRFATPVVAYIFAKLRREWNNRVGSTVLDPVLQTVDLIYLPQVK